MKRTVFGQNHLSDLTRFVRKPWFVIAVILLVVTSGAAAGTVLSGYVAGGVSVQVSTPVKLEKPLAVAVSSGKNAFTSLDATGRSFKAAVEVTSDGDAFL